MNKHIWFFMLLIPTLIYPSDEDEDDFVALLCNENHHAHDNMNALERLKYLYSNHNIAYIKWISSDKEKHAIVARYRRYDKNSGDRFVVLTKNLENGDTMVRSTKEVLHDTGEAQVIECEAEAQIVSELKRDLALFEVRFDDHKDRHYYCWQESDDSQ